MFNELFRYKAMTSTFEYINVNLGFGRAWEFEYKFFSL